MTTADLLWFIINTSLEALKHYLGGDKTKVPLAVARIAAASHKVYEQERGMPLDMDKIREYEPIAAPEPSEPGDPATT